MNDYLNVSTFFLIFALMLVVYGGLLISTGDKALLPIQTVHSIRAKGDVRRVGRITAVVGLVVGIAALLLRLIAS